MKQTYSSKSHYNHIHNLYHLCRLDLHCFSGFVLGLRFGCKSPYNQDVGNNSPSPYPKKSIDKVLATTKTNLNEWVTVKANVKEDFKKFHNLDVNELDGIAIMSDTDNSKKKSITYYQNIYFSSQ